MTFIEFFKQQFLDEAATTRKMLARVPENQFDYKPHPKSMDMKRLATHIADLPGWVSMTLNTDEIDFSQPHEQPVINSHADLISYFENRYQDGLATLVPENEKLLGKPWTLRNGDTVYATNPKIEVLRMSLSQQIHHRAQLGVYLRLLNIPVPCSYGPSADENNFN
jgi:uncharacterized damage-inducible protein DinB